MVSQTIGTPQDKLRGVFNKFGGQLTFRVTRDEESWLAECNEIPGLFTGAPNAEPSNDEIDSMVKDAIFSAFGVGHGEVPELKRTIKANLAAPSLNIAQPLLNANALIAFLGNNTELAHA